MVEQFYGSREMVMRVRFRRKASLKAQLDLAARQLRDEAEAFPPGRKRDSMLRRARQSQITSDLAEWLTLQGPQPPKG
jgi:hypothetical protein